MELQEIFTNEIIRSSADIFLRALAIGFGIALPIGTFLFICKIIFERNY